LTPRITDERFILKEPKETIERIVRFLRDSLEKTGASVLVLGMSGGLDSSVAAALCSKAVGGKRVIGVHMPERETHSASASNDARTVARKFNIKMTTLDITNLVTAASSTLILKRTRGNLIALGNIKARPRALILYYLANTNNGIVIGTGDKSEFMLGYFTKYGDGACDFLPLADLFKTTLRDLATYLGVPKSIYSKPSSPELWPGQTAESELGLGYDRLDLILWGLERWMTDEEIAGETELPAAVVRRVRNRWVRTEHKRRLPLVLKSGYRTAGADMRLPL
jgi:NAD+ synthase